MSALQVKKYEEGLSNIPISRLYVFAKVLNTPLKYFFNSSEEEKLKADVTMKILLIIKLNIYSKK
ncbi:hypothetical protein N7280_02675 [Rickettsia rhipicephali]|uniref:hypothetical protein n=1 Tax=Rickettsia rhipicephali TaxID=33992 RepID=UPI00224D4ACA|nr:hypothetical protein [Rickettsia rhipicephali]MCX4079547.1 hypothetical protein [Rickettsia rhipicephali]